MIVRPALESDVEPAVRVMASAMAASADYGFPDSGGIFDHWMFRVSGYLAGTYHPGGALPPRRVLVACRDEEVVGLIAGHRTTRFGADAELQWAFVHPDRQRRGVGGQMLGNLAEWFRAEGCRRVVVNASADMATRAFYLRYGAVAMDEHWVFWEDVAGCFPPPDRL